MVKKVTVNNVSKPMSFKHWDLITFILKRKKTAITTVAAILGYYISQDLSGILAGPIVEIIWSLVEYYIKK